MRPLGELEMEVMRALWRGGRPMPISDIGLSLHRPHPLAHTTVITVAERLRAKGWLERRRIGRSYYYEPRITAEEYSAHLMTQVLDESEDRPAALLRFAGTLDPTDAAALRAALKAATAPDEESEA